MPGKHFILRSPLFDPKAWDEHISPLIDQLDGRAGGCVCVTLEVDPMSQNFVRPSFAVFHDQERKIIRRAIVKSREKARGGAEPAMNHQSHSSANVAQTRRQSEGGATLTTPP